MKTNRTSPSGLVPGIVDGLRTLASRVVPRRISPVVPPFVITDRHERDVEIRPYTEEDSELLVEMYDDFDPGQRAQGVPPLNTADIRAWLADILDGPAVVAYADDQIVGHVSFVPDGTGRHELAIFVHQEYQQAGIGSHLLAGGMGYAKQHDVAYVWLSVEKWKRYQQRFYNRAGFSAINPFGIEYRMSRTL